MPLVILVRHGRTKANADGILAGWTPGVHLDDQGESQVATVAERLAPLERPDMMDADAAVELVVEPHLVERTIGVAGQLDAVHAEIG